MRNLLTIDPIPAAKNSWLMRFILGLEELLNMGPLELERVI